MLLEVEMTDTIHHDMSHCLSEKSEHATATVASLRMRWK